MKVAWSCILLSILCVVAGSAIAGDPAELDLKTDKVIIFKDGYSLFIRSGTARCNEEGEVYTEEIPDAAVLGSFWAIAEDGPPITMRAGYQDITNRIETVVSCSSHLEVLKANEGKECTIRMQDKTVYTGRIGETLFREDKVAIPLESLETLNIRSSVLSTPTASYSHLQATGSHFVMKTVEGDVLLPVGSIHSITMKELKTTRDDVVTRTERKKRLTFCFDKPGTRKRLTIMYFRPGMRWIPTYRIDLDPEKQRAALRLQAELLNEAENLAGVPIDIVVGVPNFRFRTVVSPLILERVLRDTLQQAAPQIMGQSNAMYNSLFTQRASEMPRSVRHGSDSGTGGSITLPSELTTVGAQDLFVYNLPKLTLRRGERTAVHVLDTTIDYRDVYTWEARIQRPDIATAPSGSGCTSPLALSKNEVWHQIELRNNTKIPWTTGAAMIMDGLQPLAQELLTYTSPGDTVRVPVTVSVDTRGTVTEKEIGRQLKALTWDHYHYAKISNEASIRLTNRKDKPVDVEITFRFGGKVEEAADGADVVIAPYDAQDWQNYRGSPAVNNSSAVSWHVTIKPGKDFTSAVKYHYYARH